jgi:hypothetical protein
MRHSQRRATDELVDGGSTSVRSGNRAQSDGGNEGKLYGDPGLVLFGGNEALVASADPAA